MNAIRQLWFRCAALFRRRSLEAEMAEEMRQHLERRMQEKIADGMPSDEARYAAQREFGGVAQVEELCRDARRFVWLEQFAQDVRYAARQLRRHPGFAVTAIAILAVGIGATTAIFSLVNGIVLKPLPYDQPGQLVELFESARPGDQNAVSPGVFFDWREQGTSFEGVAAYSSVALNFNGDAEPERINGVRMSANALQLLRARPVAGRLFAPDEDQSGRDQAIVLTYRLWQRRFNGDRGVVGRTTSINGESYTIIGVLPDGFLPFHTEEFVVPLGLETSRDRRNQWLRVLARLKPGVSITQSQAELDTIARRIQPLLPSWKKGWTMLVVPLQERLVQQIKPALIVLLGAVGLVLLIACANVANLLLARASARQREIAVRAAMGASRGRIVRQLLAESVFLSLAGAAFGLLFASWSVGGLRHVLETMNLARVHEVALDGPVLATALAVSLLTGIGFGLAPAWQASRTDVNHALKDAARGSTAGGNRMRRALIIGEVAVALMLLIGAGLLLHSFARLVNVRTGIAPGNAFTLQLSLSGPKYPGNAERIAFFNRVAEAVGALPGVEAAGLTQTLPLRSSPPGVFFRVASRTAQPELGYDIHYDFCTPDYFRAIGIPLLRGRSFTAHEAGTGARVAIINAACAREIFLNEDPLGQHFERGGERWEIVGIVGDVRMEGLTRPVRPMIYRLGAGPSQGWSSATLVVRTGTLPLSMVDRVRRQLQEIDSSQPVANVQALDAVVAASLAERRLILGLLGAFAVVALLLAAIGLYGVMAYAVTQRTREFGIRLALGASGPDVLAAVLRQGLTLVVVGLAVGLASAFSLTHLLTNLLYEITPTDPLTFVVVPLALMVVALFACWLPARRATRVDPMVALRCE
jgi:putative ABC transport system permease protein